MTTSDVGSSPVMLRSWDAPAWRWAAAILTISIAGWLLTLALMWGMDQGPGTPLHSLPIFVFGWVLMLTAMMLPTELTYVGALAALLDESAGTATARKATIACFVAGYALAWISYGLAAYVLDTAVRSANLNFLSWYRAGPLVAGSGLILAGLYQVSPLKRSCLLHCRTPLSFFSRSWRPGSGGALKMGLHHGLVCVGCCWALMAVMFVVGIMSLTWMALLTAFMFAEKILSNGDRLAVPIAGFLCVMGLWIAVAPETAPLLKDPMVFQYGICRSFL